MRTRVSATSRKSRERGVKRDQKGKAKSIAVVPKEEEDIPSKVSLKTSMTLSRSRTARLKTMFIQNRSCYSMVPLTAATTKYVCVHKYL